MLVIRLTRVGKKNTPAFRVVVADKKRSAKRKFIEILGHYNPSINPKTVVINKEKALGWIKKGAQPSDTVLNLMCDLEILPKNKKVKIVYGKATKKKDKGKTEEKAEIKVKSPAEDIETAEQPDEESPEPANVGADALPDATSEADSPELKTKNQNDAPETEKQ